MQSNSTLFHENPITLVSNYFNFSSFPLNSVFSYFVEFTPEIETSNKLLKNYLISKSRGEISRFLPKFYYYETIISTTYHNSPFVVSTKGHNGIEYNLLIRYVSCIDPESTQFLWYLNILIKFQLKELGLKQLTSKPIFFNNDQVINLREIGLSIWNGYKASVNLINNRFLFCLDSCSKIINNKNVLETIQEIYHKNPEIRRKKIAESLENKIVMTVYSKKFYRIKSLDFDSNPLSLFVFNEKEISFREYYANQYNIEIKDLSQPLLNVEQKRMKLKIIPELCALTGISESAKRNGNLMRQVRNANNSDPHQRYGTIFNQSLKMASQISESNGLVLDSTAISVRAFELNPVNILLKSESLQSSDRGFSIKSPIKNAVPISLLTICYDSYNYDNANYLDSALRNRLKNCGVVLENLTFFEYSSSEALFNFVKAPHDSNHFPSILVIILQKRDRTYDICKQISCEINLPIQCILSQQFNNDRKIENIITNMAHQIAAKTGSQLWTIPQIEGIPKITMVVGMDVYHDTVNKKESVLGFSSSLNPFFTKYFSTIRKQAKIGEEISNAVEGCFREALQAFYEETKKRYLPSLIVVYRDGVGDSMIDAVKEIEVNGLKRVISEHQGYDPEIVYIIVMKRIDQRFFSNVQGKMGNPKAGTLINDPLVCDPHTFYLISSCVNQGTATPVKYKIIENTSKVNLSLLENFTYGLCHLYYNWKGSIKLPCPTQLSHKLAYIVGENTHKDACKGLKKTLWYL